MIWYCCDYFVNVIVVCEYYGSVIVICKYNGSVIDVYGNKLKEDEGGCGEE